MKVTITFSKLKWFLWVSFVILGAVVVFGYAQVNVRAESIGYACDADYDKNGTVTFADLTIFDQNYKKQDIDCSLDIAESNCFLDAADLHLLATIYNVVDACVDQPSPAEEYMYGVFEDGQLQSSDQIFRNTINDMKNHNMNAILFTNTQPDLSVSDELDFKVIAAPMNKLYSEFYKADSTPSLQEARNILYPVVDNLRNHPSLQGYNIHDDAIPDNNEKMELITKVFSERDSVNPISQLLITGKLAQEVYDYLEPKSYLSYDFPFKANTAPCEVDRGNKYWIYSQRESFQLKPEDDPLWMVLQAHKTIDGPPDPNDSSGLRQPSPTEMSIQFWEAVGEEADGIFWYTYSTSPFPEAGQYWDGLVDLPQHYAKAAELGGYRQQLDTYLSNARKIPDRFKVSGRNYISTFVDKNDADKYYVIVVNQSCNQQNLKVTSDYFGGGLKDLISGQNYNMGTDILFAAGEGKMFQITNKTTKTPPATQPNIAQNSSFESLNNGKPNDWLTSDPISMDTNVKHTGNYSLRMTNSSGRVYQNTYLSPSTDYYFSYWLKTSNLDESEVGMRVVQVTPDVNYLTSTIWDSSRSQGWTKRVGFFTTPANTNKSRFDIIWNLGEGETLWVDDVTLCKADDPCEDEYLIERLKKSTPASSSSSSTSSSSTTTSTTSSQTSSTSSSPPAAATAVPHPVKNYTQSAEDWWATHPYNPQTTANNYIPVGGINSDGPTINVCNYKAGSDTAGIEESINLLPDSGGTLYFDPDCGPYHMTRDLNWDANIYKQDFSWVNGGVHLNILKRNNIHFVSDSRKATIIGSFHITSFQFRVNQGMKPVRNFYFKNLIFQNPDNDKHFAFLFEDAEDILFDNVIFDNTGALTVMNNNNVFYRNVTVQGSDNPGLNFDGGQFSGILNSNFYNTNPIGIDFHVNMDATWDGDFNGQLDMYEQRQPKYFIGKGNVLEATSYNNRVVVGGFRDAIWEDNTVIGPAKAFIKMEADTRLTRDTDWYYDYYNYIVRNNNLIDVQYLFELKVPSNIRKGRIFVGNNTANNMDQIYYHAETTGSIEAPVDICGNTIGNVPVDGNCP